MRGLLYAGGALAAVGSVMAFGAIAQPAAGARPPEPLTVITEFAHVDKANVGGGDCSKAGVLQSDKGPLNTAHYFVECVSRPSSKAPFNPEIHPQGQDQVYYIIKGETTMYYGGQIVGKELVGNTTAVHLSAGDVAVLPAGVPNWFKEVPSDLSYVLVRRKE